MSYTLLGKVQYILSENKYDIVDTVYTDIVDVKVQVMLQDCDMFENLITDKTNAEVVIIKGEKNLVAVLVNN